MIKRVYGSFNNGPQIDFTPQDNGQWVAIVPETPDGEYVVALWAEDEYGNTSYYATMLFIVKAHEITAVKQLPDYYLEKRDGFRLEGILSKYELVRVCKVG